MDMFKFLIVFAEQASIGFAKPGFKENTAWARVFKQQLLIKICTFWIFKKIKNKIWFHIIGYFLKALNMLDVYLSYT